jgi:hypothetical protein
MISAMDDMVGESFSTTVLQIRIRTFRTGSYKDLHIIYLFELTIEQYNKYREILCLLLHK